jgi:phosphoglycolate phosphatase
LSATPYRVLVFDWDGTLLDSIGPIIACTLAAFADLGLSVSAERVRSAIGLGLKETLEMFFPQASPAELEAVYLRYRDHWWTTYRDQTQLFPGVDTTLGSLAAAGYQLAVATAKSRRGLERDLEVTGLGGRFVATRTVDEAPSKPHPQMLLDLLAVTGSRATEAVMIGDTAHDLQMAANAGMRAIGVLSGSHDAPSLLAAGPLALLGGVWELPDFLASRVASRRLESTAGD